MRRKFISLIAGIAAAFASVSLAPAADYPVRPVTIVVAFTPGANWSYFPSVPEIVITVGLVAFEVLAYIVIVRTFPILAARSRVERQAA